MPIILKNSVFYHIPKTGGSWIRERLKEFSNVSVVKIEKENIFNLTRGHETPKIFPPEHDKTFAFVRKPENWYWSFWNYRQDNNWDENFILDQKCESGNFNTFMENVLKEFPDGFVSSMYKEFLGEDGKGLTRVGRQENLREDLLDILKEFDEVYDENIILHSARVNNSTASKKEMEIRKDLLEKLREKEIWTYNRFYKEVI